MFLQQVFSLLLTHPGSLAYNLVLAFSVLAALLVGLNQARNPPTEQTDRSQRRMLIGFSLLLTFRMVLFVTAGLAWQGLISTDWILPFFERSIDLLSLLVIIWLWVFPYPNRAADVTALILAITVIILTFRGISGGLPLGLDQTFNGSTPDGYAQFASIGLALLGIILLLIRRPTGWPMGLVMLAILGAGHLFQLWQPLPGSFSGVVRLTQMIAYPLLIVIPFRQQVLAASSNSDSKDGQTGSPAVSASIYESDRYLQDLIMEWTLADNPSQAGCQLAARAASELQAEICLFLWPPDAHGFLVGRYGYDMVHRLPVPEFRIAPQAAPILSLAFQQGNVLSLPGNSTAPDLHELARLLNLQRSGALLSAPVKGEDGRPILQVVMLMPFSGRRWSGADQERLAKLAIPLAYILQRNWQIAKIQDELVQARQSLQSSQERVLKAENDRRTLLDMVTIMQQAPGSDGIIFGRSPSGLSDSDPKESAPFHPAQPGQNMGGDSVEQVKEPPGSTGGSDREQP